MSNSFFSSHFPESESEPVVTCTPPLCRSPTIASWADLSVDSEKNHVDEASEPVECEPTIEPVHTFIAPSPNKSPMLMFSEEYEYKEWKFLLVVYSLDEACLVSKRKKYRWFHLYQLDTGTVWDYKPKQNRFENKITVVRKDFATAIKLYSQVVRKF